MGKYTELEVWHAGSVIRYEVPNKWLDEQRGYDLDPEALYASAVLAGIVEPCIGFASWAGI